ncbi:hypothetical protein C5Q97_09620 [Victivallales bacterium CCUG 44730]|nr:hypothetical protein C5Q97_09620 [Victivallales bacterium CCUG 44730]
MERKKTSAGSGVSTGSADQRVPPGVSISSREGCRFRRHTLPHSSFSRRMSRYGARRMRGAAMASEPSRSQTGMTRSSGSSPS